MDKIKLGDCATFINGYAFKPEDWNTEGLPIIRIQNLNNENVPYNYCNKNISKQYIVENGDILISWSGSIGVFEWKNGQAVLNQHIFKVVFDKIKINKQYFVYLINTKLAEMIKNTHGSTMKHITKTNFDNLVVCLHDLQTQQKIVEELDCISDVIEKKKEQLKELDNLVKSQFNEMFGNFQLSNQLETWKELCSIGKIIGGSTPKTTVAEFWDGSLNWFTPAEIKENDFYVYESERKITEKGAHSCSLKLMPINTVILSSRAPIGKVAIARCQFYCNQGFKNIICGNEINYIYLYTLLKNNSEYLKSLGKGATFKEISKSIVEKIKIPVPSIDLQNKFAEFVEQINKSKFSIQKSIKELENLFNSRMQYYFGE